MEPIPEDVARIILGNEVDQYTIFASGATPETIADIIEGAVRDVDAVTLRDFGTLITLAAIGNRRLSEEYINQHIGVNAFVRVNFALNNRVNFSQLSLAGHLFMAAVGNTGVGIINGFRTKIRGMSIWDADLNSATISEDQKRIFMERKSRYTLATVRAAGARIVGAIYNRFKTIDAAANVPGPVVEEALASEEEGEDINIIVTDADAAAALDAAEGGGSRSIASRTSGSEAKAKRKAGIAEKLKVRRTARRVKVKGKGKAPESPSMTVDGTDADAGTAADAPPDV